MLRFHVAHCLLRGSDANEVDGADDAKFNSANATVKAVRDVLTASRQHIAVAYLGQGVILMTPAVVVP
jgi:hypothetical protein